MESYKYVIVAIICSFLYEIDLTFILIVTNIRDSL